MCMGGAGVLNVIRRWRSQLMKFFLLGMQISRFSGIMGRMLENINIPPPILPGLPQSGETAYNSMMGAIEPELAFPSVTQLEQKYHNESPEERQNRARRYAQAYELYAKRSQEVQAAMHQNVAGYTRAALRYVEHLWHGEEQKTLVLIESRIQAL